MVQRRRLRSSARDAAAPSSDSDNGAASQSPPPPMAAEPTRNAPIPQPLQASQQALLAPAAAAVLTFSSSQPLHTESPTLADFPLRHLSTPPLLAHAVSPSVHRSSPQASQPLPPPLSLSSPLVASLKKRTGQHDREWKQDEQQVEQELEWPRLPQRKRRHTADSPLPLPQLLASALHAAATRVVVQPPSVSSTTAATVMSRWQAEATSASASVPSSPFSPSAAVWTDSPLSDPVTGRRRQKRLHTATLPMVSTAFLSPSLSSRQQSTARSHRDSQRSLRADADAHSAHAVITTPTRSDELGARRIGLVSPEADKERPALGKSTALDGPRDGSAPDGGSGTSSDRFVDWVAPLLPVYESWSPNQQSYYLMQLMRSTRTPALQFLHAILLPALKRDFLSLLPRELASYILHQLDLPSLGICAQVCKRWRTLVDSDARLWRWQIVWEGWQERLEKDLLQRHHLDPRFMTSPQLPNSPIVPINDLFDEAQPFKKLMERYCRIRRNWYTGTSRTTVFSAHGSQVVTSLLLDGDQFISGSEDNTILLFDLPKTSIPFDEHSNRSLPVTNPTLVQRFVGHEGGVWCLELMGRSRDVLVSGSTDRNVRVWDSQSGICMSILSGHSSTIRCMAIFPHATAGPLLPTEGEQFEWWNLPGVNAKQRMVQLKRSYLQSLIHQGAQQAGPSRTSTLATSTSDVVTVEIESFFIVTGSRDRTLKIWGVDLIHLPADMMDEADDHASRPSLNSFDEFGRHSDGPQRSNSWTHASNISQSTTDIPAGPDPRSKAYGRLKDGGGVRKSGNQSRGQKALSQLHSWKEMANTKRTFRFFSSTPHPPTSRPNEESIGNEGNRSTGDRPNGSEPRGGDNDPDPDDDGGLEPLIEEPYRARYVVRSKLLYTLHGHSDSVRSIAASAVSVISGSYDCSVRVWNMRLEDMGHCAHILTGHAHKVYSVVCNASGTRACSGSMDSTIRIWDCTAGACLHTLDGHSSLVGLLQLTDLPYRPTPPPRRYQHTSASGVTPGHSHVTSFALQAGRRIRSPVMKQSVVSSHLPPSPHLTKRPILVSAAADGTLRIWDLNTGQLIHTMYGHPAAITCFMFDSDKCISGSEGCFKMWDLRHGGQFIRDVSGSDRLMQPAQAVDDRTGLGNIESAWRITMDHRRLIVASKRNQQTFLEVHDFDVMP